MALNKVAILFVMGVIVFCSLASSIEGRRLLMKVENTNIPLSGEESLYRAALPKGKVAASTPSRRGNAAVYDREFIARHLAALDRILRSVPSPGVGH